MTVPSVANEHLELAQASYARCQKAPEFFRAFYDRFIASDPSIPAYFTHTRFDKQEKLLQHGLSLLLIYAKRPNPNLLQRLSERHGPTDLNIPLRFYPLFLESLILTVRQFDPQCDDATVDAWRSALAPGVARMMDPRT
jgi:hemoglobin-like flavoprotein